MPRFPLAMPEAHAQRRAARHDIESAWLLETARHLLTCPVDEAIPRILASLGTQAGADRAWMLEYSADLTRFRSTHEWCRPAVSSHLNDLIWAPTSLIGWLHQRLLKGQPVMIADVRQLPRVARPMQVEMLRQNDKSVLSVPMFHAGRLRGLFGFDAVLRHRHWRPGVARTLLACGELIMLARHTTRPEPPAVSETPPADAIYLQAGRSLRGITLQQLAGLRASGDYVCAHLLDGTQLLDSRPLSQWADLLPPLRFFRIHRSALVALNAVTELQRRASGGWQVRLRGQDDWWPVSRRQVATLRSKLGF